MRQAQQIYRTMGAGGIRVGLMDDQGWQRYDPAMFDEPAPPPKIQYKREWLFPKALPAGFTSNFDLEGGEVIDLSGDTPDPKGKGKRKAPPVAQRMLVCAKCVEPLRAGASDKSVRVWALRCGHVIDGRCLLALAEDPERAAAFAEIEPQASTSTSSSPSSSKRKQPARRVAKGRTTRGKKASAAKSAAAQEEETLVLAEHEWSCPVGSCGRKHASQLVKRASGPPQWVQKSGSGAIQLFV
ncbi:hypothetical protein EXIGLDRAFT_721729 [Exidia glandulosa HHB12029]|uniref:Uncharacterized protein n=1 Tax=Exidia glandulosa HHB12029 TaxID=1314781 RepID=A0A165QF46_EXIGL|nr:hypothetical protein EXIGLDRAFT_721729 [Exidia glandulosa HHB12029]